jgi:hypothetical protein
MNGARFSGTRNAFTMAEEEHSASIWKALIEAESRIPHSWGKRSQTRD